MIAIIGLFNKSIFPSKYKVCGGLGMFFNCLGYRFSSILIFFIKSLLYCKIIISKNKAILNILKMPIL